MGQPPAQSISNIRCIEMIFDQSLPPLGPTAPLIETLLAGVAIRIELTPSLHLIAVERYSAIRKHIERAESPLHDKVRWFYPQGSMAIKSTVRSPKRDDGYDIDLIAELDLPHSTPPSVVLDLLFAAIKGQKGSRYYEMAERQTRCVTVYYEDGMHLDVSPAILLEERDPRRSNIFHANPSESSALHKPILTNSWAFVEHFNLNMPVDIVFEQAYAKRVQDFALSTRADADVKPVPAHSTVEGGKSAMVVALQLLKSNRNLTYSKRKGVRMPPSVMLAALSLKCEAPLGSISAALMALATYILQQLEVAKGLGKLIHVVNPTCQGDCFTDRWPENHDAQNLYISDLKLFISQLKALSDPYQSLDNMQSLLMKMFGERVAIDAIDENARNRGILIQKGQRISSPTGSVIPAIMGSAALCSPAVAKTPGHTFFGNQWRRK